MKKISFCGISGNGMSALAQIMKLKGYDVQGSDLNFDNGLDQDRKKALQDVGIKIYPQDGKNITSDLETLYITNGINEKNPDIKAALDQNIPLKKRSDLLAELFHQYEFNIAVGGTCGKTTTTAMIAYILDKLGYSPCMINGGFLKNYAQRPGLANYIYNQGKYCVIEADESDGSIVKYHPYIALINNISHDHKPIEELKSYFREFSQHAKFGVVVNADCPHASKISQHPNTKCYSILNKEADLFADEIRLSERGISYKIEGKEFHLQILGRFNVYNALAAILSCQMLGIDKFEAAKALETFLGTQRRLELIGKTSDNISVYDDFAHNPQKIEATLSTLREYEGRIIAVYQSHTPFSARNTGEEDGEVFGKTLNPTDILLMPEIYERNPEVDTDISASDLVEMAKRHGTNAHFLPTKADVKKYILQHAQSGDKIVIMGAHDNSLPQFCQTLLKELKNGQH